MPTLAGHRKVVVTMSALSAATSIALLSACSSPQHASSVPGTTPAIWTGSPAPSGTAGAEGEGAGHPSVTTLRAPDGTQVATAKFDFSNGYATITIATTGVGEIAPGFHGVHIHKVGKCEANSVGPTGGAPGDFLSAGGHFQAPGHSTEPASGDLTSLQVRRDGVGTLVTSTDAFTMEDLLTGEKTAIIIHAGADNFANIPPERYSQTNGTPGPDATTMSTGDSGKRVACGVIGAG
ncbi:superoxide dismutase[Cu-Zn] [Mycobacterium montefiorense]|uniref:Superoxide dismutase [Cu-Zn] n=1 Tax=Mycobacterium montefiorense TaxID=154654 RepID=A0AA37UUE9_9MYCO|nr:superoxide dismutase family protein [Mycobacterium montefiorense]GBG40493.1 superoxide dismutase [Cu-Zn] [Mycobacterium montefiorense]GKU36408.1 superoxide dismutase [Cu-Zn] [Mycobacterium montefiorense]GKU39338.1 superoxide dismutase [Cu-Zn] [Mycobacterium montefiorense]GKU44673.1 superoxide dismutase [Cu-Zn] [Mycobacterium montefiorense]GKU54059.1 superoxide dismutase [Cu-Zn] [Mycobacterium montefiorense]